MDLQLIALCGLTFVIHLIGTLAYAVRIAGVRTRRIAVSFALFNVLVLVSRTSNSLQGPFLAKRIEATLKGHIPNHLLADFRWLLLSATVATLVGAVSVPTFQRLFSRAVLHFQTHRSIPKLLLHVFAKGGLSHVRESVTAPAPQHLSDLKRRPEVSASVIVLNVGAQALVTVAVFAALYAGSLNPAYRVTASTLSSVINGGATILLSVFIDPHLSIMTDDVVEGRTSEAAFSTRGGLAIGRPDRRNAVGPGPARARRPADRPDRGAALERVGRQSGSDEQTAIQKSPSEVEPHDELL